ncbi:transketolase [Nitrincola sp. MINF-07-Sa-05]|uniref:transketolase n=1 Tax=Nitrincola salilacus TaxID=3400273 RepID=UPI003918642C
MHPRDVARKIRVISLTIANSTKLGHPGGDLSCADIMAVLFSRILYPNIDNISCPDRNRFILSKGHAALSYYSALYLRNIISYDELMTFSAENSLFSGHPASEKIKAVETSTGPLGHGLPIGVGMALAARLQNSDRKIFVLCGDGEMQEGSNWEAAMLAGHQRLSNLVCIIDRNLFQHSKSTEDVVSLSSLPEMFHSFGWHVSLINGHNINQLEEILTEFSENKRSKPHCIICNTVKGKGVSFMEEMPEWHHKIPTDDQLEKALLELNS